MSSLPVIQMFWHGPPLSRVERLSLASFVRNGHPVHLYAYDEIAGVPSGVTLRDAAEILPRTAIFRHRRTQSLAPFADWFRYRLLFERGGIWADTDMVCLQAFEYAQPRLFAWQDETFINNAVIGLRAGDPLASWMAESCEHPNRWLPYDDLGSRVRKVKRRFLNGNHRGVVRWGEGGPTGLTRAVIISATVLRPCRAGISIRCRTRTSKFCSKAPVWAMTLGSSTAVPCTCGTLRSSGKSRVARRGGSRPTRRSSGYARGILMGNVRR